VVISAHFPSHSHLIELAFLPSFVTWLTLLNSPFSTLHSGTPSARQANSLQNITDIPARTAGDYFPPRFVGDDFFGGENGPVWTRLRFQPFEIIDLVPLVGARFGRVLRRKDKIGMKFGQWAEPDPLAAFDDGSAVAVKVYINIFTFVHPQLLTLDHENAVFHACDMRRTCY